MIVYISYDNIWATIDGPVPVEIDMLLHQNLKFHPSGYEHVYSYKNKRWDGYNYLYDLNEHRFRRGLVNRVIDLLKDHGYEVRTKWITAEQPDVTYRYDDKLVRPYDFQEEMVTSGVNNNMGIIVASTGAGKTVVISKLIDRVHKKTVVIVTDLVLMDQMAQALQTYFGDKIGMIGDGEFDIQDITVSTIQSLSSITKGKSIKAAENRKKLLGYISEVGMLVMDEVHMGDADSFAEVLPFFTRTPKFIGVSATAYGWAEKSEKKENLELEQHFGTVIYDCRHLDFIALGLKSPLRVEVIHRDPVNAKYNTIFKKDKKGNPKKEIDWTANYKLALDTEILKNDQYHSEVASKAFELMSHGKSTFVHAAHSIEFGERIQNMIPGSVLVNGATPRLERRGIYDAMRTGDLLCIVSDLGGTGLNIPSLGGMILASDVRDIRQIEGRVTRAYSGKEYGILTDFHTHTQFLSKHADIRRSQYKHAESIVDIGSK